jgi:hypothetical protein
MRKARTRLLVLHFILLTLAVLVFPSPVINQSRVPEQQAGAQDTMYASFKFLAIALSGLSGAVGLLGKSKDDADRLTRSGRVAVAVLIVSSCVALILQGMDMVRERVKELSAAERARDAAERSEKILTEVNRGLNRISVSDIRLSFQLEIPLVDEQLREYVRRVRKEAEGLKKSKRDRQPAARVTVDCGGEMLSVSIPPDSYLLPRHGEKVAQAMLRFFHVGIQFYKSPIPIKENVYFTNVLRQPPDLEIFMDTRYKHDGIVEDRTVDCYFKPEERLEIRRYRMPPAPSGWTLSTRIVAISDLSKAQLFLALGIGYSEDSDIRKRHERVRREVKLRHCSFSLAPWA